MSDKQPTQPILKIALAVVLLVVAALVLWMQAKPATYEQAVRPVYYYDLAGGDLFVDSDDKLPPFATAGGGEAVMAHVFSCTACTEAERFVGFLSRYDDATKAKLDAMTPQERAQMGPQLLEEVNAGKLIAAPDGKQWAPFDSDAAMAIMQSPPMRCGGPEAVVQACEPSGID